MGVVPWSLPSESLSKNPNCQLFFLPAMCLFVRQ